MSDGEMNGGDFLKNGVGRERVGGSRGEGEGETVDERRRGSGDSFGDSELGSDAGR